MTDDELGAAHLLVRRSLAMARGMPETAILFRGPLRVRGRVARGSDFLARKRLRRLLMWPLDPPELAIVLVDEDGDNHRYRTLRQRVKDLPVSKVVAVAVREFETWLVADVDAVKALHADPPHPGAKIEALAPRQCKEALTDCLARCEHVRDPADARRTLARTCDLEVLARRCGSFKRMLRDLSAF